MVTLTKTFKDEYGTELVEFVADDDGYIDYGYVDKELLFECITNKKYDAYFYVAMQLKVGPEDVEDAVKNCYNLKY